MVIETDILSKGIWSKRIFMSSTESMATPAIPTSPRTLTLSESYPRCVARSNATEMKIRERIQLSTQDLKN